MSIKSLFSSIFSENDISIIRKSFTLIIETSDTTYEELLEIKSFPYCETIQDACELIDDCLENKRYTYDDNSIILHLLILFGKKNKQIDVTIQLQHKKYLDSIYTRQDLKDSIKPLKDEIEELKSEIMLLKEEKYITLDYIVDKLQIPKDVEYLTLPLYLHISGWYKEYFYQRIGHNQSIPSNWGIRSDSKKIIKQDTNKYVILNEDDLQITKLKNLQVLHITGNGDNSIKDLSFLSELNLKELRISTLPKLFDLTPVTKITTLEIFNISDCKSIENYSCIRSMKSLKELVIDGKHQAI